MELCYSVYLYKMELLYIISMCYRRPVAGSCFPATIPTLTINSRALPPIDYSKSHTHIYKSVYIRAEQVQYGAQIELHPVLGPPDA